MKPVGLGANQKFWRLPRSCYLDALRDMRDIFPLWDVVPRSHVIRLFEVRVQRA